MAVNQKHITIASYNYLNELSAIPLKTRNAYLDLLLRRKNSAKQKNVVLLNCLYEYIDDNKLSEWDPKTVCKKTGLNMNALYIQKSRLLKGLREYYFKWKKTEKVIQEKTNLEFSNRSFYKADEPVITFSLQKARKMAEIGMTREARYEYLKLEKIMKSSTSFSQTEMYLIYSEIYEYLSYYFYNKRQKRKLLSINKKLYSILNIINNLKVNITENQKAVLEIRSYFVKFHNYCIEWYKNPKTCMTENFPDKICTLSKKYNLIGYYLRALHGKIILELVKENNITAKILCKEGFKIADKHKNTSAKYTFASMIYYINLKTHSGKYEYKNDSILNYYDKIKRTNPFELWTIYLENSIVMSYYIDKSKRILDIFREQIISNIILGDFGFSVFFKFVLDSEVYYNKIIKYFNIFNIHFNGYLEIQKIDYEILNDIKKLCLNTECYHTKIKDFGLTWQVHKLKLISYFFREDDFDYDEVENTLKIMALLKKKNRIIPGVLTYELLKLGFEMLELEHNPKKLLNRFELKFKKTIEDFKSNPKEFTITDYAIISSLARRLRCKEITAIVKDLYHWLETHHPEILAPALREIEERASKVKLIDGSKQSAA